MDRDSSVIIIEVGIVGSSLAATLTQQGCKQVVVLEQGPLFTPGGSTSHAPGGVFQTTFARTMTQFAQETVCMYTTTPDHDFLVGSPPGVHQLTILGGFSGHGFKFSPVMGEVAADLALHGGTEHPVGFLSLDRFLRKPEVTHRGMT